MTPELRWGAAGAGCRQRCGPFLLAPALAAAQGLHSWKELSCSLPAPDLTPAARGLFGRGLSLGGTFPENVK